MKTILEVIQLSSVYLAEKGVVRPKREAEDLIASLLNVHRLDLYLQFDKPLTEGELLQLRDALKRRGQREPFSYITGKVEFFGVNLSVNSAVLIPRPETEILVQKASAFLEKENRHNKILWDCCTGSGCIAIALKKRFPELQVIGSDISRRALNLARCNAIQNQVDIVFKEGDLFEPMHDIKVDYFICNPPYISMQDYQILEPEVKNYEPQEALIGGVSGFEYYARIGQNLKRFLSPIGKGWLEIGALQGVKVKKIFESHGWSCRYEQDWSGVDRFFFLEN